MSRFVQLHFLTAYAPSNLNRDDLGRPKTALFGGTQRLRVSSQSLKRAWRTSEVFKKELEGHVGTRTKDFGNIVHARIAEALGEAKAHAIAQAIAAEFGKVATGEGEKARRTEQLAHIAPGERAALEGLAATIVKEKRDPTEEELGALLSEATGACDIALFGRMLAAKPRFNVEASAQVAHALSVHKVAIEDDYFTAVDDLNTRREDSGAGHVGSQEFASAVLYHYVCIDRELLKNNLGGDEPLVQKTLGALTRAALTVAPNGKQASFASRALASYALAEKGDSQPRSLAAAFLKPAQGEDLLAAAVAALTATKANFDKVYDSPVASTSFDAARGEGKLADLVAFVQGA